MLLAVSNKPKMTRNIADVKSGFCALQKIKTTIQTKSKTRLVDEARFEQTLSDKIKRKIARPQYLSFSSHPWCIFVSYGIRRKINPTSPRGGAHDSRTDNNRAEDADRTLDWPTQVVAEAASRKKPSSLSRTNSPGGEVLPAALSGISIPAAKQAATFGIAPDNISSGNKVEGVSGVNWLSTAAESRIKPEGAPIASDVTAEATSHASNNKSSGLGGWLNAATTSGRLVLSTDGNGGGNCTATQSENERRTQTKKGSKYAATLPPPTSGSWLTAALTSGLLGVSCGENDGDVGTSREQPRFGVSEIATQTNELAVTEIKGELKPIELNFARVKTMDMSCRCQRHSFDVIHR